MPETHTQHSEVARLLAQINEEYEAAQRGLAGLAQGTSQHQFINKRMERIGECHSQLRSILGSEAMILIAAQQEQVTPGEQLADQKWGRAMTIDETFETMKRLFNPMAAAGFNKIIQWDIKGVQAGKWAFAIAGQTCQLIRGGVDKAHLTMSMSDQTWLAISEGKLDPINAFMASKITMSGDMMLAMRLQHLFPITGRFFGE